MSRWSHLVQMWFNFSFVLWNSHLISFLYFFVNFLSLYPPPTRPRHQQHKTFFNYRRASKKNKKRKKKRCWKKKKSDFLIPSLFFIINLTSQFLRASGFVLNFYAFSSFHLTRSFVRLLVCVPILPVFIDGTSCVTSFLKGTNRTAKKIRGECGGNGTLKVRIRRKK